MGKLNNILPKLINCPECKEELELDDNEREEKKLICPNCNKFIDFSLYGSSETKPVDMTNFELLSSEWAEYMQSKTKELELKLEKLDSRIPDSAIINPNFWTRAFAVYGHLVSIYLIFFIAVFLFIFVFKLY